MKFDPSAVKSRLEKFWSLKAKFGMERGATHTFLNEIVSDRYTLVNGLQLVRDELQLADWAEKTDIAACGADFSVPSVVSTLAHTNCGDRIHQGEATTGYEQTVASRFATMSEIGELKLEAFSPTGGGTDDGATLAHVTVAHQLDEPLRARLYSGNALSFVLVCIDLKTHVGRLDNPQGQVNFGRTRESPWREPRTACGAVVGTLKSFNPENAVHARIRDDLGEANFEYLSKEGVKIDGGIDATAAVASSIVAIQGMWNTAVALASELDERGVGHLTASVTVNRESMNDPVIYLSRTTVFGGEIRTQGFGTDARAYGGRMVDHHAEKRLVLTYAGRELWDHPIESLPYDVRRSTQAHPHDV